MTTNNIVKQWFRFVLAFCELMISRLKPCSVGGLITAVCFYDIQISLSLKIHSSLADRLAVFQSGVSPNAQRGDVSVIWGKVEGEERDMEKRTKNILEVSDLLCSGRYSSIFHKTEKWPDISTETCICPRWKTGFSYMTMVYYIEKYLQSLFCK